MSETKRPNLNGLPIALGIARAYGYEIPQKACAYHIDANGQTCLSVTGMPISTVILVKDNHVQV
jgi:hypothetical protein